MTTVDGGAFEDFLDAIEDADPYYLECSNGHGAEPPQRIYPTCQARDLERTPLPATGEISTFTVVHVPPPRFADESPYVTAIAEFGPVTLTGQLRDVEPDAVDVGQSVAVDVDASETTGDRVLVFRPA